MFPPGSIGYDGLKPTNDEDDINEEHDIPEIGDEENDDRFECEDPRDWRTFKEGPEAWKLALDQQEEHRLYELTCQQQRRHKLLVYWHKLSVKFRNWIKSQKS